MTFQETLFDSKPVLVGDIYDQIAYLLELYPRTQERYMEVYLRYYETFQGLREIVESGNWKAFERWWLYKAKNPKTLLQRTQEVQNRSPELEPTGVREKRRKQSKQGRIGL